MDFYLPQKHHIEWTTRNYENNFRSHAQAETM